MLADVSMRFAAGLWTLFVESSLYILVGFAIAGLLHVWVPETFIRRILGHGRIGSIFTAALLGIPLPLCSCSVLPTAIAMRRMGASRGATVSYLISEPETGPDSIAITYGLMGPLIAVYRPAAALLAAMVAGLLVEWRGGPEVGDERAPAAGCGHDLDHGHDHDHGAGHAHDPGADAHPGHTDDPAPEPTAAADRPRLRDVRGWIGGALRYGFVDLLDDLSHWLLLGLAIGAAVTAFVPASAIGGYLGSGFLPLVLMALIGVPIYICAAASTPIAAALMLKGLSPGAALVLLLTGPATNLGSMAVLVRHLGRRVVGIYLAVVVVVSIVMGALLDALYALLGTRPEVRLGGEPGWLPGWVWTGAALLLAALLARSMLRAPIPGEFSSVARVVERLSGVRVTRRRVAWLGTAAALAAWLSTGIAVVKPGERGVRLTLGRVSHELAPRAPSRLAGAAHADGGDAGGGVAGGRALGVGGGRPGRGAAERRRGGAPVPHRGPRPGGGRRARRVPRRRPRGASPGSSSRGSARGSRSTVWRSTRCARRCSSSTRSVTSPPRARMPPRPSSWRAASATRRSRAPAARRPRWPSRARRRAPPTWRARRQRRMPSRSRPRRSATGAPSPSAGCGSRRRKPCSPARPRSCGETAREHAAWTCGGATPRRRRRRSAAADVERAHRARRPGRSAGSEGSACALSRKTAPRTTAVKARCDRTRSRFVSELDRECWCFG
ncbi:MAG: SO_0444 family Cu/Zn efflux transporter [Deltaproteobacteria bacterium]|nr:SO_0444 family Cu/Zn efflux transporter [Deltaproteobacteria bacterium]